MTKCCDAAFFESLAWWRELAGETEAPALLLVYGGNDAFTFKGIPTRSWQAL